MPETIQIRRGLKANLPASAALGEFLWCSDTHEIFVGNGPGNALTEAAANAALIASIPVLVQAPNNGQLLIFDSTTGKYIPGDPIVSGPDAVGVAPTRNPVQVGVLDSAGHVIAVAENADGGIPVHVVNSAGGGGALETGGNLAAARTDLDTLAGTVAGGKVKTTPDLPLLAAQDGTDGAAPPAIPGTGIRGWLRSIYDTLKGTLTDNIAQWGGTAVSAPPASGVPPAGTEVAPVTKPIQRKKTDLTLAVSCTSAGQLSAWQDTQSTGAVSISISNVYAGGNYASASVLQSDDQVGVFSVCSTSAQGAGIYSQASGLVTCRYWRVLVSYGGGGTITGTVWCTTSPAPTNVIVGGSATLYAGGLGSGVLPVTNQGPAAAEGNQAQGVFGGYNGLIQGTLATASMLFTSGSVVSTVFQRTPNVFKTLAAVAVTAGTPVAAWTPAAGKKFRLMGYALSLSVAGAVIMKDAAAELIRTPLMAAGIGQPSPPIGNGILSAVANNVLNIDVTATGSVSGFVFGTEE